MPHQLFFCVEMWSSVIRDLPGLWCHIGYSFVWGCDLQLLGPCGLSWYSARNVRPWYQVCTVPFQSTYIGRQLQQYLIWYVGKWLWYGTQLSTALVRLIITNQTSDICYTFRHQLLVYLCDSWLSYQLLVTVVIVVLYLYSYCYQIYFSLDVYHVI